MRDLLPVEARQQARLSGRLLDVFALHGYERVVVPVFEYASIFEGGSGELGPDELMRFVEPDTGEIVALRPDMTPQVARLLTAHLGALSLPARLCYQGSVLRRRRERARRNRQVPQAGVELVGLSGQAGDLEVVELAVHAMRGSGLTDFVLDLSHAKIAGSLLDLASEPYRAPLAEALLHKDRAELERQSAEAHLDRAHCQALVGIAELHGGAELWPRAEALLSGTVCEPGLRELWALWEKLRQLVGSGRVVVDLGEPRNLSYYTGTTFQILADGPGEAVVSGGRYDGLYSRFGADHPAAGFAVDLDNLHWALSALGEVDPAPIKLLICPAPDFRAEVAEELSRRLRGAGISNAMLSHGDPGSYARAWGYSHIVHLAQAGGRLVDVGSGRVESLDCSNAEAMASAMRRRWLDVRSQPPFTGAAEK